MKDVLNNLIDGLKRFSEIVGRQGRVPVKSAITKARKRVGPRVMSKLFNNLTRPLATEQTPGAFFEDLRIVIIDGTTIDLPDTPENARLFGYPGTIKLNSLTIILQLIVPKSLVPNRDNLHIWITILTSIGSSGFIRKFFAKIQILNDDTSAF